MARLAMMAIALLVVGSSLLIGSVDAHGMVLSPPARSSHGQTYGAATQCNSKAPWSNRSEPCGLGCVGDACLYYQVGCYCGCPVCSLAGKDLYATPAALKLAGDCAPIAPTLDRTREHELRTMNIDGLSPAGDWTRVNPWRAPGHTGRGNPRFQPCGVNSGMDVGARRFQSRLGALSHTKLANGPARCCRREEPAPDGQAAALQPRTADCQWHGSSSAQRAADNLEGRLRGIGRVRALRQPRRRL